MKKSLLLILSIAVIGLSSLIAQPCTPNPDYVSLGEGVYPYPYNVDSLASGYLGIQDTAVVGENFEFTFTAVVPNTLLNGSVDLFTVRIDSITNLPEGLSYDCDPDACLFSAPIDGDPTSGLGCVSINGTTTDDPGSYSIIVYATAGTSLGDVEVTFPPDADNFFNFPPGEYLVHVAEGEGTDVADFSDRISSLRSYPNPFTNETRISFLSESAGPVSLDIFDIRGKKVHSEERILRAGENEFVFNGSHLPEGTYIYGLSGKDANMMNKFTISR